MLAKKQLGTARALSAMLSKAVIVTQTATPGGLRQTFQALNRQIQLAKTCRLFIASEDMSGAEQGPFRSDFGLSLKLIENRHRNFERGPAGPMLFV